MGAGGGNIYIYMYPAKVLKERERKEGKKGGKERKRKKGRKEETEGEKEREVSNQFKS